MLNIHQENQTRQNGDQAQLSSQSALPMSRKRTSDSHTGPSPFTSTGSAVPPLTLNSFRNDDNDPFSIYTIHKAQRTLHGRKPIHIPVTEYNDPKDYLAGVESNRSPSALQVQQYGSLGTSPTFSHSPTTPTTTDGTNQTMLTSTGRSRPNSQIGSMVCESLDMLRLKSQASNASSTFDSAGQDSRVPTTKDFQCDSSHAMFNNPHLLDFTGAMVPEVPQQTLSVPPLSSSPLSSAATAQDLSLQRTASAESNASSSLRVSQSGPATAQALQPLAPKLENVAPPMSRSISSEHRMIRVRSADGSVKDKVSIAKAPYQRPQQPKIKCLHCNRKPDGYRGEHELGRHINKAHSLTRTVWICVDPSPNGNFLSACKACNRGKRYNAYYNAAAHLRRAHFNPRPKGRKGKTSDVTTVKRAGSSGGEQPPMEYCKMWMREIREYVPQNALPYNDAEDDDEDTTIDQADAQPMQQHRQAPQSLLFDQGQPLAHSIPMPYPTTTGSGQVMYPPTLSLSAPATQLADDDSLYLSQPSQASASSDKADILDLSLDTSVGAALPFQMSPFTENPNVFDGFSQSKFC